jgi:hypothetical protein
MMFEDSEIFWSSQNVYLSVTWYFMRWIDTISSSQIVHVNVTSYLKMIARFCEVLKMFMWMLHDVILKKIVRYLEFSKCLSNVTWWYSEEYGELFWSSQNVNVNVAWFKVPEMFMWMLHDVILKKMVRYFGVLKMFI